METLIIENLTEEEAQDIIDFILDRQDDNLMEIVTVGRVSD